MRVRPTVKWRSGEKGRESSEIEERGKPRNDHCFQGLGNSGWQASDEGLFVESAVNEYQTPRLLMKSANAFDTKWISRTAAEPFRLPAEQSRPPANELSLSRVEQWLRFHCRRWQTRLARRYSHGQTTLSSSRRQRIASLNTGCFAV